MICHFATFAVITRRNYYAAARSASCHNGFVNCRAEMTNEGIVLILTEPIGHLTEQQKQALIAMKVSGKSEDPEMFRLYELGLVGPMGHGRYELAPAGRAVIELLSP